MTDIDWNAYIESPTVTESNVKDEGDFATIAVDDENGDWYKLFVGLRTGHIIRHDSALTLKDDRLEKDDLVQVLEELGRFTNTSLEYQD